LSLLSHGLRAIFWKQFAFNDIGCINDFAISWVISQSH